MLQEKNYKVSKREIKVKVIIVDDEIKICRLIYKYIHWDELGLEFCDFCYDGVDALQKIDIYKPDVIITDISMPNIDGIELISNIRNLSKNCYILIISGYSDFEYAKKAINLGVNDYLLKPINQSELNNALKKIVDRDKIKKEYFEKNGQLESQIKLQREVIKSKVLTELMFSDVSAANGEFSSASINSKYGTVFNDLKKYQLFYIWINTVNNMNIELSVTMIIDKIVNSNLICDVEEYIISYRNNCIIILINHDNECQFAEELIRKIRRIVRENKELLNINNAYFFVTKAENNMINILNRRNEYSLLLSLRYEMYSFGVLVENKKEIPDNIPVKKIDEIGDIFYHAVEIFDLEQVHELKLKILLFLNEYKKECGIVLYILCQKIIGKLFKISKQGSLDLENTLIKDLKNIYNINSEYSVFVDEADKLITDFINDVNSRERKERAKTVELGKKYIELHYCEDLSLETVGRNIGLNPSYLSNTFKKEYGISFVDYIIQVRIEHSKELLIQTDRTINDIAYEVGYSNPKYFSKLFRKVIGISPKEYRKLYAW